MSNIKVLTNKATKVDMVLNEAFELVTHLAEIDYETRKHKKQLCIPTGFHNIDHHIDGLWPGELTVVTGAPGVGKTSFASNLHGVKYLRVEQLR